MLKLNEYEKCLLNNKVMLKSQQRFKSEAHNVYTEEVNKIPLSSNDKRLQTFDRITSYPYGSSAGKVCKTEILSKIYMINFDDYTNDNKTEHNLKQPYIPDHPYRILTVAGSGSRKTNAILNLINNQSDIDKIYLYAKDPYKANLMMKVARYVQSTKNRKLVILVIMACDLMCLKRTHMSSISNSLSHASEPQRPRRVIVLDLYNHW